jgi:hypothetical protein
LGNELFMVCSRLGKLAERGELPGVNGLLPATVLYGRILRCYTPVVGRAGRTQRAPPRAGKGR